MKKTKSNIVMSSIVNLLIIVLISCSTKEKILLQEYGKLDSLTQLQVLEFVEKMPEYKGGDQMLLLDFNKNLDSNLSTVEDKPRYLLFQFVISKNGKLLGARIKNKKDNDLSNFEKAAISSLNLLQNWSAGVHQKNNVNVILSKKIHIDMNN